MSLTLQNKIILGDCIEKMKEIQKSSIDAIITDPPFTMAGGITHGKQNR